MGNTRPIKSPVFPGSYRILATKILGSDWSIQTAEGAISHNTREPDHSSSVAVRPLYFVDLSSNTLES